MGFVLLDIFAWWLNSLIHKMGLVKVPTLILTQVWGRVLWLFKCIQLCDLRTAARQASLSFTIPPRVCSDPHPLSPGCYLTISSSVTLLPSIFLPFKGSIWLYSSMDENPRQIPLTFGMILMNLLCIH